MINKFTISDAKVLDDRAGIVEAYVNTMGIRDADGDIIDPAAFNASIKSNLPIPVLAGHDQSKLVGWKDNREAHPRPGLGRGVSGHPRRLSFNVNHRR